MRKITLYLAIIAMFLGSNLFAQTTVYDVNESFGTDVTSWDFALNNGGTQTISYNSTNKLLQFRWPNSSSEYIKTLSTAITPGTDNQVTIELIIKAYTCGSSSNYGALYFADESGNVITGFHVRRGSIGGSNKWFVGRATSYPGTTTYSYPTSADGLNADQPIVKITFILDFNAKTVSFTALQGAFDYSTRVFTAAGSTVSSTAQTFINTSATNIKSLKSWYYRGASTTGTNGFDLMYAGISALRMVSTANVTINYLDPLNNPIKDARIATGNVVGTTYTALNSDKATTSTGGFYYVYDVANTTDNAVVLQDGTAAINLKFTKSPVISGTYTWTGSSSANWNETETNFTTDGSNSVGYQFGNAVTFDATGANKSIILNNEFDLGSNNVTLSGNGYSLAGSGKITGTGKTIINTNEGDVTTLNLINLQTGGVDVNGGTVIVSKSDAASKFTITNGSTLNLSTGSDFNKEINVTGTIKIIPTSNNIYSSNIINAESITYTLPNSGSVSTSAFSNLPTLNNNYSGNIIVQTTLSSAYFGSTINLPKVSLGDNVYLVYPVNPATGGTTITIGELTGTSLSKLMGNRIARAMNYNIGGSNTDFTFAGKIENFPADAWAGLPIINFSKVGTGTMTLTGKSIGFNTGSITVSTGSLVINDSIGTTTVPATVAAGATLKGTGTIGGATTINGTLEGRLNFGSTLALAGTTNLTVNGFNAGEFDVITVTGAATLGGILNVTVNAAAPANGTSIKLINAASYTGDFTQPVNVPANYSFDKATGMLTYSTTTEVNGISNNFSIYPTLTRGDVQVNAENISSIEVVNLIGQSVKQIKTTASNNTIKLNDLSMGAYLIKVRFNDGSVKAQRILFQR